MGDFAAEVFDEVGAGIAGTCEAWDQYVFSKDDAKSGATTPEECNEIKKMEWKVCRPRYLESGNFKEYMECLERYRRAYRECLDNLGVGYQ